MQKKKERKKDSDTNKRPRLIQQKQFYKHARSCVSWMHYSTHFIL